MLPTCRNSSPERRRGLLLASSVFFWQGASFVAALVAIYIVPHFTWRGMFVAGAIPTFIWRLCFFACRKLVRFLIARGRLAEAEGIARRLSTVAPETITVTELPKAPTNAGLMALLRGGYLKATLSVWIMQFCGGAVFVSLAVWLPSVFVRMGFPVVRSFLFTAAIQAPVRSAISAPACYWTGSDAVRPWRHSFCSVVWSCWPGGSHITERQSQCWELLLPFLEPVVPVDRSFTYTSEIYPTRFRGAGTGWAAGWQRIGGIVAPVLLGSLLTARPAPIFLCGYGHGTFGRQPGDDNPWHRNPRQIA